MAREAAHMVKIETPFARGVRFFESSSDAKETLTEQLPIRYVYLLEVEPGLSRAVGRAPHALAYIRVPPGVNSDYARQAHVRVAVSDSQLDLVRAVVLDFSQPDSVPAVFFGYQRVAPKLYAELPQPAMWFESGEGIGGKTTRPYEVSH